MKKLIIMVAIIAASFTQQAIAHDDAKQSLQKAITDYINLTNVLAKDNAELAQAAAKTLNEDLKNAMEQLKPYQHKIVMKYHDALINDASAMSSTTDIEKIRASFKTFSPHFFKILKELKVNTNDLFYQYCPMADAYWVSDNSKIANPYLGKKMPTCGSTKDKIKANK
jgi:hypothetical protein